MGPLTPATCTPVPTSVGAAIGLPDRPCQDDLLVSGGLLQAADDRQASTAVWQPRPDPPIHHHPESERRILRIDIDVHVQTGGDHDFINNNPARDHAKTGLQHTGGEDGTTTEPSADVPFYGTDGGGSTFDEASSDSSTDDGGYDLDTRDDSGDAASSSTSSAISSPSSLHSSASSSSSEASTLTTTSSRRGPHDDPGGGRDVPGEVAAATLVLIGCRMCLTYYMVSKPGRACPRCGDNGDHIVRFGGDADT